MESFPREQLHPGDGWRVRREARTFLGGSYTLVHKVNGGREMGTNAAPTALCGAGEGKHGLSRAAAAASASLVCSQTPQECNAVT